MKNTLTLIFLCISLVSCSQNKKNMDSVTNLLGNLDAQVKFREQAVNYHAGIHVGGCSFEFFVNDMPVVQYFGDGNGTMNTSAPINPYILHSGKQTYRLVVYPALFKGEQTTTLSTGVEMDIAIEGLRHRADGVDNIVPRFQLLSTPKKKDADGNEVYADAGKNIMVYQGTFEAKVPYELTGWSQSADLTKEDTSRLKTEVVAAYNALAGLIKAKDLNGIARLVYEKEKELAQSLFYNHENAEENVKEFMDTYGRDGLEMQPLENYKLVFYGPRVVALERVDLKGKSPLLAFYKGNDGRKKYKMYYCYLHKPKGSNKLEIIR